MKDNLTRKYLDVKAGTTIFASTGKIGGGHLDRMSTLDFYKADRGSKISLLNRDYYFNVATYSLDFDEKYIYTYSYQEEQSWTIYNHDLSGDSYRQADYIFSDEVYFRICLKRKDGANFTDEEANHINDILTFFTPDINYKVKPYFKDEIEKTVIQVNGKRAKESIVLGILTDSHVTTNGTWEDTAYNIKAVNQEMIFDGIIHLGDLTDGILPAELTKKHAEKIINDLKENQVPLYIVIGNHDTNYFYKNPEPFSEQEQYEIYQKHSRRYIEGDSNNLYYYIDFERASLRCLFLTSFDDKEKIRYGFSDEILIWVEEVLKSTPLGYSVVIFSHDAPLARLDYWSEVIRNGDALMAILEDYHLNKGKRIMAFIHGHTHADYVYTKREFPIVSIACAKCEYFTDKKPKGSVTPKRKLNTVTQDLWDTVVVTPSESKIDFIRFGAGENRTVYC